jgi:Zn-dependent protease with chaperone function
MSSVDPSARNFTPRNPETFFAAQKRNRRATWRMSALSVFAAFIMGIPLTLVLTPLLYALTLIAAQIIDHFSPLPPEFWQQANQLAKFGARVADYVVNQRGTVEPGELALALVLFLLPGMLVAFGLWFAMLLMFRRGGVGGALASLNAREPNPNDLEELQLADVAQEMAIAAGLPAPKLMLVDSPGANAAAIGTCAEDARIVISRRLLDDLDREQMQAILGHLIGSIGNGDLRIAFTVTSVFETCGLLVTLINAPFGSESRGRVWRMLRYMLKGGTPEQKAIEAAGIAESLASSVDANQTDIDKYFNQGNPNLIRKFFRLVMFPIVFTNLSVEITLWFFLNLLLGPCMALLWRTRRYLADASSVALTRNPDALATALECLSNDPSTALAGGEWATHLFIVNPKGDSTLRTGISREQLRKTAEAWRASSPGASDTPSPGASTTGPAAAPFTGVSNAGAPSSAGAGATPPDYATLRQEMKATWMAAVKGDPQAVARITAMAAMMGENPNFKLHGMPNPADIIAAQKGDRAALARIMQHRQAEQRQETAAQGGPRRGQSGLQIQSFLSFHPPLNRRAKRLQRMGSHLIAPVRAGGLGLKIFMTVLYLIVGPLLAAAGVMMLFVIAMMITLNLMVLGIWLTVIHWIFVLWNGK